MIWICRFYPVSVIHQTIEIHPIKMSKCVVTSKIYVGAGRKFPAFFYVRDAKILLESRGQPQWGSLNKGSKCVWNQFWKSVI